MHIDLDNHLVWWILRGREEDDVLLDDWAEPERVEVLDLGLERVEVLRVFVLGRVNTAKCLVL